MIGRAVAVAAVAVFAVACGGTSPPSEPAQPPPAPSADSVAADHGLISGKHIAPTLYAAEEETATSGGRTFDVVTFRTNDLRDKWLAAAAAFGSYPKWTGDRYAIVPE